MEKSRFVGRKFVFVLVSVSAWGLVACSSHPCREPRAPDLDQTKAAVPVTTPSSVATAGQPGAPVTPAAASVAGAPSPAPIKPARIHIYKPDGSRQCEPKGAKSVEMMERELAGIVVYAREKRKDGLMHIQICGSPSGMINLYEIDSTFLKQAEERGFKRLED